MKIKYKKPLAICIMPGAVSKEGRAITIACVDSIRGHNLTQVIWLRKPTDYDRMTIAPTLIATGGKEYHAY